MQTVFGRLECLKRKQKCSNIVLLSKISRSVLLQRKCLINEASLSIGSKTKRNHNGILLKHNKTIAEWFALFNKVSTVPAASSSPLGEPCGCREGPEFASLSVPSVQNSHLRRLISLFVVCSLCHK